MRLLHVYSKWKDRGKRIRGVRPEYQQVKDDDDGGGKKWEGEAVEQARAPGDDDDGVVGEGHDGKK